MVSRVGTGTLQGGRAGRAGCLSGGQFLASHSKMSVPVCVLMLSKCTRKFWLTRSQKCSEMKGTMELMSWVILVLAGVIVLSMLVRAGRAMLLGRMGKALRYLVTATVVAGSYFAILMGSSIRTGTRDLRLGDSLCFGDWCASVMEAAHQGGSVQVTLRTENRRDGSPVRPDSPDDRVVDDGGREADLVGTPVPALDAPLQPGESLTRQLVFSTPPGASELHVEISQGSWINRLLITGEASPSRRRARLRID